MKEYLVSEQLLQSIANYVSQNPSVQLMAALQQLKPVEKEDAPAS